MDKTGFWERPGKNRAIGAFVASLVLLAAYSLVSQLAMFALMLFSGLSPLDNGDASGFYSDVRVPILVMLIFSQALVFGFGTTYLFRKWHGVALRPRFRVGKIDPLRSLLAIAGAIGLVPVATLAGELFPRLFPVIREVQAQSEGLFAVKGLSQLFLLYAAVALTPALFEEYLFRGYFQSTLSMAVKAPWSWIVSGLYFALIHRNYFGLIALVLAGLYLAYLFHASKSIWPGVFAHGTYNAALITVATKPNWFAWAFDRDGLLYPLWALAGLFVLALSLFAMNALGKRPVSGTGGPLDEQSSDNVVNPV